jgi:hypothetical protein
MMARTLNGGGETQTGGWHSTIAVLLNWGENILSGRPPQDGPSLPGMVQLLLAEEVTFNIYPSQGLTQMRYQETRADAAFYTSAKY